MSIYFTFVLSLFGFTAALSTRLLITLLALGQGATTVTVGLLASVLAICPLVLSIPVGLMADRFGGRWLLFSSAALTTCGVLVPVFVPGIEALYATALLAGLGFSFKTVVLQNLVGLQSKPGERTRNFSNYSLITASCLLLGPLLTGVLVDLVGGPATCLYIVVLNALSMAMLLIWGGGLPRGRGRVAAPVQKEAGVSGRAVWRALLVSSCVQLSLDLFQFCIPIYGHDIGLSPSAIGMVLGAFAAAAFVARVAMPRLIARMGEQRLLSATFWLGVAAFLLIPLSQNAIVLGVIAFLYGIGMGCSTPLSIMMMYSHSPEGRSGSALGLRLTANNTLRVVGPSIYGAIGSAFGLWPIFLLSAAVMAGGGYLSRPSVTLIGMKD
jgi:MFS family permease